MTAEVNSQAAGNPIIDHLDLWSSVYVKKATTGRGSNGKVTPYGIQKLRKLILELAVRGKLVPQDPNDESASLLLKRIDEAKSQLIKEGKLKKQKALPEVSAEEKTFELPLNWKWTRLQNCYDVRDGTHDSPKPQLEGFPLVTSKNLYTGRLDLTDVKYISEEDHRKIIERSRVDKGDILFAMIGSIGNPVIVDIDEEFSIKNVALFKYYSLNLSVPRYLQIFLEEAATEMKEKAAGGVQSFVSLGKLRKYVIGLPPLEEQHRIVAKVDELMALCDQLEQQQTDSLQAHQTLVETLLATLVRPTAIDDVKDAQVSHEARTLGATGGSEENAEAIFFEHFDTLFTTEESIDQLKQTILQLAVMGRLVPQDPNEEPASVLLDKIKEEQARLIKDEKIKKKKAMPEIAGDEKAFNVPFGWEWVRLGALSPEFQNGASSRGDKEGEEVVVLRLADIDNWRISLADTRTLTIAESSISKYWLEKNDVLIIRVNGSADIVGRFVLCDREIEAIYCDHFIRMRFPVQALVPAYFELLGSSSLVRKRISDLFVSTAGQKTVNQKHIGSLAITLPPLAEQNRIVAKVDELMAHCDALKARIQDAQTTQVHLADAVVEQAVA